MLINKQFMMWAGSPHFARRLKAWMYCGFILGVPLFLAVGFFCYIMNCASGEGTVWVQLTKFFQQFSKVGVAFSGGVDSAYLLYAAKQSGCEVRAYIVQSQFQPQFEHNDARRLAEQLQVSLQVVPIDILAQPEVAANGPMRCYYCKKALFSRLLQVSREDGCQVLLDGTNATDQIEDRPGMRALQELGIRSPLRECGLGKKEIRTLSRQAGLFTYNKPSYACLATRIPQGEPIDEAQLKRVEQGEQALFALGFTDFRLRCYHQAARLQLPQEQFSRALALRQEIVDALQGKFEAVLLDLIPRSGD